MNAVNTITTRPIISIKDWGDRINDALKAFSFDCTTFLPLSISFNYIAHITLLFFNVLFTTDNVCLVIYKAKFNNLSTNTCYIWTIIILFLFKLLYILCSTIWAISSIVIHIIYFSICIKIGLTM